MAIFWLINDIINIFRKQRLLEYVKHNCSCTISPLTCPTPAAAQDDCEHSDQQHDCDARIDPWVRWSVKLHPHIFAKHLRKNRKVQHLMSSNTEWSKKERQSDLLCFQEVPVPHESQRNFNLCILWFICRWSDLKKQKKCTLQTMLFAIYNIYSNNNWDHVLCTL